MFDSLLYVIANVSDKSAPAALFIRRAKVTLRDYVESPSGNDDNCSCFIYLQIL